MSLPRGPWGLSRGSCLENVGVEKRRYQVTRQAAWRSLRRVDEGKAPQTRNTLDTAAKGLHPRTSFTAGPLSSDEEMREHFRVTKAGTFLSRNTSISLASKTLREQDSDRGAGLGGQFEQGLSPPPGAPLLTGSSGS